MRLTSDWIDHARKAWADKPALREFYQHDIFDPIIAALIDGPTVELGSGPGFFSTYHGNVVSTDINTGATVDVCCDVQSLPFRSESFANVVGIDVLHHFARPAAVLREAARVLRPNGRLVLCEPWTGPVGWCFYRYLHHDDCRATSDPWRQALPDDKAAMVGNANIPKTLLYDCAHELSAEVPGLIIIRQTPFAGPASVLTGGFGTWGFPLALVRAALTVERVLPGVVMRWIGLRFLCVLEKTG